MNLDKKTQELFDKCYAIELLNKMADGIIYKLAHDIHIDIDLSRYENTLIQHRFSREGKFHFLTALQLNYPNIPNDERLNEFVSEMRGHLHNEDIKEECFEKILKQLFVWFEDELHLKDFQINLFTTKCNEKQIENHKFIFLIFEFCFKSPALSEVYSFDKIDVRRQVLYRLEYISYSFLQQAKSFTKNIVDEVVEKLKFNYTLKECFEYVRYKEVELRRDFINEFFFTIEHFLSSIRKHYAIKESSDLEKKELLKEIFNHFDIEKEVDLEEIKQYLKERCSETSDDIWQIFDGKNIKKDFFLYHTYMIQLRNSLHSNGKASKDMQMFKFGKVNFYKLEKDKFHKSMSIVHLVVLALIDMIAIEKIIEKTKDEEIIKDEYMIELDKLQKQEESQLSSNKRIMRC